MAQVDTLLALCRNVGSDGCVCSMIDARHGEVFAAVTEGGSIVRDAAPVGIDELLDELKGRNVIFTGDGAANYSEKITGASEGFSIAAEDDLLQKGSSVCLVGYDMFLAGDTVSYFGIVPRYLKKSQAERNRELGR